MMPLTIVTAAETVRPTTVKFVPFSVSVDKDRSNKKSQHLKNLDENELYLYETLCVHGFLAQIL